MKYAIEKIEARIVLICKRNDISFNRESREKTIIYSLDNYKLGYIRIDINLDINLNLSEVILYGTNDELLKIANKIENSRKLFELDIDKYNLVRTDYQNTKLKVVFDKFAIEEFEKINNKSQNYLNDKIDYFKPTKKAYDSSYISSTEPITFLSWKFIRPENYFIVLNDNSIPDENGNINCHFCVNCKNCTNCIGCRDCQDLDECTNCNKCTNCYQCSDLTMCSDCDGCIDCLGCNELFACDGVIGSSFLGNYNIVSDGVDSIKYADYKFFPDYGTTLYHEKIEAFFLINRFFPYKRPYDFANNYNWSIQWSITRGSRRYWITEKPSNKYKNRFYSISELAAFFMMNKLKYMKHEFEAYFCEYFSLSDVYLTSNTEELINKILISQLNDGQWIYDGTRTKRPQDCLYNHLLYDLT